jgi:hypothetical protein
MTPPRRFTLLDSMILVAAVAIGMALELPQLDIALNYWSADYPFPFIEWFLLHSDAAPALMPLTIAAIALRLRRPRPAIRRAFRGPGMAGCLATLPGLILLNILRPSRQFWVEGSFETGLCVLTTWGVLAALGYWRRERDWVGWMGRSICLAWIAATAAGIAGEFLYSFQ